MPNVVGLAGSGTKPASAGGGVIAGSVAFDDEHARMARQKGAARPMPHPLPARADSLIET
jgi:hypothetical protein